MNVYKPAGMTSYDVIRYFKRNIGIPFKKIGHFGTLDPFAEGVLLIAFNRATRLNNFVHDELPKTYLAKGILGVFTETGDLTSEISKRDETPYLNEKIAHFPKEFIEEMLRKQFLGVYWQEPHKYSAAKFEGRKLYEWAREGQDIKKEKKRREIHKIEVTRYEFPYLDIRFEVSSGTYIRSLFLECAQYLGTLGTLQNLIREKIGSVSIEQSMKQDQWPVREIPINIKPYCLDFLRLLPYPAQTFDAIEIQKLKNGGTLRSRESLESLSFLWSHDEGKQIHSLLQVKDSQLCPVINF
ncbi:MAG: tRNA pseudouridine(55) synthase TruB [Halobacteriovoraceae bacterium]|nr:tRNA pseudouridine(55) synthase TruB [Halobacteriovoraceae bacterium]